MPNKLFHSRENPSVSWKKKSFMTKHQLLKTLLKCNVSLWKKVKIWLLPSVKEGLAIGLIGAKTRGSAVALSPGFTKQHLNSGEVGVAEGGFFNTQIIKGDEATAIGGFSLFWSKQSAQWNGNKLIQGWAGGIAEQIAEWDANVLLQLGAVGWAGQEWDKAKQLGAGIFAGQRWDKAKQLGAGVIAVQEWAKAKQLGAGGVAVQEWDKAKQLGAGIFAGQKWANAKQLGAVGGAVQGWDNAKQLGAVFYTSP